MQLLNTKINLVAPKFLIKPGNYNTGHESTRKQHKSEKKSQKPLKPQTDSLKHIRMDKSIGVKRANDDT